MRRPEQLDTGAELGLGPDHDRRWIEETQFMLTNTPSPMVMLVP